MSRNELNLLLTKLDVWVSHSVLPVPPIGMSAKSVSKRKAKNIIINCSTIAMRGDWRKLYEQSPVTALLQLVLEHFNNYIVCQDYAGDRFAVTSVQQLKYFLKNDSKRRYLTCC